MNLFSWKRGGMQGVFLLLKNVFNIDKNVFGLVRGSANLYVWGRMKLRNESNFGEMDFQAIQKESENKNWIETLPIKSMQQKIGLKLKNVLISMEH